MNDVTRCVNGREPQAWPGVYIEMRKLGSTIIAGERLDPTDGGLTAIVHEAWAKLQQNPPRDGWQSRAHFFGSASHAMRQCLIDQARRRNAAKRQGPNSNGAELQRSETAPAPGADDVHRLLEVDAALRELAAIDQNWASVAEMKLFGDLPSSMIAERLGTSRRSVERYWVQAAEWLRKRIG